MKQKITQIETKYSWKSKASKIVSNEDFVDKTIVITGATNGVGLATTKALIKTKAIIYVLVRNIVLAQKRFGKYPNIVIKKVDLSDFSSIVSLIKDFRESNIKIDYLINNAGIMGGKKQLDSDGLERHIKTNYLSPFILTNGLINNMSNGARIINLSSIAHKWSRVHLEDINFKIRPYSAKLAYAQSKTAGILFSTELLKQLKDKNVNVFSVHPGIIPLSSIWSPRNKVLKIIVKGLVGLLKAIQITSIINLVFLPINSRIAKHFKTNDQGASTTVWAMKENEIIKHDGSYLEDCNINGIIDENKKKAYGVAKYAIDDSKAKELWNYTIRLLKKYDFYNYVFETN
jgi:NAD(P)-dependent dehydrogenase (short-subunit alcohol dehydrogenase family)